MKLILKPFLIASMFTLILFTCACKLKDGTEPGSTARSAKFKVGGTEVTVAKPYDGIFIKDDVVDNTVQLNGADGSLVNISFTGSSPAVFQLKGYSDAYYKSPSGKQYNSVSGTLTVTTYKVDGATNTFSGTFSFTAKSLTDDTDIIQITGGVITNCSNEF